MKLYRMTFTGREVGAIGVFTRYSIVVRAESEEAARIELYQTHEHIRGLHVQVVEEDES